MASMSINSLSVLALVFASRHELPSIAPLQLTGQDQMKRTIWLAAALFAVAPAAGSAQTLGAVEQRLDKAEKAIEKLLRKKGSQLEAPQPQLPQASALGVAVDSRLDVLEQSLAGLSASAEVETRRLGEGLGQFSRFKADIEPRLEAIELQIGQLAEALKAAKASPVPAEERRSTPDSLYLEGLGYVDEKSWGKAEFAFESFIESNPDSHRLAEAKYWLGKSFLEQGKSASAAKLFLEIYERFRDSSIYIDNMYALARAIEQMNIGDIDQQCAIYSELSNNFKAELSKEQRETLIIKQEKLSCRE